MHQVSLANATACCCSWCRLLLSLLLLCHPAPHRKSPGPVPGTYGV